MYEAELGYDDYYRFYLYTSHFTVYLTYLLDLLLKQDYNKSNKTKHTDRNKDLTPPKPTTHQKG